MYNVLRNKYLNFIRKCDTVSSKNYFTNVYGLARSLFAFGTLLTLLFNSTATLFPLLQYKSSMGDDFKEINLFYMFGYEGLIISKLIALLILLSVIIGYRPRYTGLLHWWVSFSFLNSVSVVEGGDQIAAIIALFLIPMTLLDNRKSHWSASTETNRYKNFIAYMVLNLIALQVAVLYLQSALEKPYKVDEWVDGTALYYWFNNNLFGLTNFMKVIVNPILDTPVLLLIANWSVIIFEVVLFGAFFMEESKKRKLLKYGILFHFMIVLLFGLVTFFIAMSACLVIYLLPNDKMLKFKTLQSINKYFKRDRLKLIPKFNF